MFLLSPEGKVPDMSRQAELGILIVGRADNSVHPTDVEAALGRITQEWEWPEMDFIKDVRAEMIDFQDEVPPEPPVEMEGVVVALRQMPTSYADGTGDIYNGPPYLDDPLHALVSGLYEELEDVDIHIDAVSPGGN